MRIRDPRTGYFVAHDTYAKSPFNEFGQEYRVELTPSEQKQLDLDFTPLDLETTGGDAASDADYGGGGGEDKDVDAQGALDELDYTDNPIDLMDLDLPALEPYP